MNHLQIGGQQKTIDNKTHAECLRKSRVQIDYMDSDFVKEVKAKYNAKLTREADSIPLTEAHRSREEKEFYYK